MSLGKTKRAFSLRARSVRSAVFAMGLLSAIGSAVLVGGCSDGSGFRPLYATSSVGGANVSEKLQTVDIAPIPGRVGQQLRNEFIFQANGGGAPLPPEYRLEIAIRESVGPTCDEDRTACLTPTNPDEVVAREHHVGGAVPYVEVRDRRRTFNRNSNKPTRGNVSPACTPQQGPGDGPSKTAVMLRS